MSIRTTLRRGLTAAAAIGATAALALSMATAASANLPLPGAGDTHTLNVGTPADPMPNGFVVTVERHNTVDLTTHAGWSLAANTAVSHAGPWTAAPGSPATVTAEPGVSFPGLVTGLYRVSFSGGPAGSVAPAPFLVTLPFPNSAGDGWLTEVDVAPKPSTTTITKSVHDADSVGVGDNVTWTVNAPLPTLADGQLLTEFRIVDPLDPRLTFVPTASAAEFVCPSEDEGPEIRTALNAAISASGTPMVLTWDANATDLAVLNHADNADCAVELTLVTTINAATAPGLTDGVIPNQAQLFINGNANGVNSNTPEVRLGQIVIEKYDATDRDELLEGATFRLFQTREAAEAYLVDPSVGGFVTIDGESSWTTDEYGRVTISAVLLNNWVNDETVTGAEARDGWYLVETASPTGYLLLGHIIEVGQVTQWAPTYPVTYTVAVANVPDFELPATGGTGARLVVIGGAAFIVLVTIVGVTSRRR
ncbi:MAG: SpaH/EbpB family LPXTG-anchored major pilin, partial [Promicromonosporaceae bacterium]|nr:SpaH/EbpB family LPXTG-anchored major pilin [Promicromonosporaceae bacterium]